MRVSMVFVGSAAMALVPWAAAAQSAIKPTLMVMPSDAYMASAGVCTKVTIDGEERDNCSVRKLFVKDSIFGSVVSAVSNAFQARGYPMQSLEQQLKNIEADRARDLLAKKAVQMTETDKLLGSAKADIVIYLKMSRTSIMGQTKIILSLDATDVYTAEPVATKEMPSQPSATLSPQELATAVVVAIMPEIEGKLLTHFQRARDEGRRVRLRVKILEAAGLNDGIDTDIKVNGEEMSVRDYITKWARKFAVNGQYQPGSKGENFVNFITYNIPFGVDPDEYLSTMIRQFNKDTGLRARAADAAAPGDLLVTIDKKS